MTDINSILGVLFVVSGLMLMFVGSLGILRLPDFYCRAHASGKADTLGIIVLLTGVALYEGFTLTTAKLVIAIFFIGLTNPVASHALARAAMRFGQKPWFPGPGKSGQVRE